MLKFIKWYFSDPFRIIGTIIFPFVAGTVIHTWSQFPPTGKFITIGLFISSTIAYTAIILKEWNRR